MATQQAPTPNEIKHRLRQQGKTLKIWAEENGFQYRTVSDTLRGLRKGNFGECRDVKIALGLPVED
jgi:gp16 family phage-associated protein